MGARSERLALHHDMCERVKKIVDDSKLVEVAEFEQDLATGVDRGGKEVSDKGLEKDLRAQLIDPQLSVSVKTRLLLLFLSSTEGMGISEAKRKDLARFLDLQDRQLPVSKHWADAQRRESPEVVARRKQRFRDRARSSGSDSTER